MKILTLTTTLAALAFVTACSQADVQSAAQTTEDTVQKVAEKTQVQAEKTTAPNYDFSAIPAGKYVDEDTHAYITFQYWHQGYTRPTIRWNEFEATVDLNKEDPAASTLNVTIDAASIDSGVKKFDDHLKNADMFEVDTYPTITFTSTDIDLANGTLTGDLTMKETTKPVTLSATLNKVGESRGGKPMFGISAKTQIMRSEWGLGYAVPFVGDEVDITIEVEFQKAE